MKNYSQLGFTLIEMMMVIILVAILAAIAIPQFLDFRTDAKNASLTASLGAIRTSISIQIGQMSLRCDSAAGNFPSFSQIQNNDITNGGSPCTTAMIPNLSERNFMPNQFPDNPWSGSSVTAAGKHAVTQCSAAGCARNGVKSCDSSNWGPTSGGWCYNPATGILWANSNNNGATPEEYSY